jgi:phosphate transport system substrate-binding protein
MARPSSALRWIAFAAVFLLTALAGGSAQATPTHEGIEGTGSSWAALAVQQWIYDTNKSGLRITYTDSGSAQGRKDFAAGNTDFGVTDIGYQCLAGQQCDVRDQGDTSSRPYAYLPIVGGGTAFPYNISVAGHRVTNLRLSGETVAKIFTNKITNWDDPQITKDNNGHPLPSIPIIPVVHSEGAGSTAMFTRYLAKMFPSIWGPFNGGSAEMTEYFPRQGQQVAQYGSDGVMNLISGSSGNGTIGYNEYAYALAANMPVAKVENAAHYYTLPTQFNDAVALTRAKINMDKSSPDYLLQDLDGVYTNPDPRSYALSSYSYGLIPTAPNDSRMTSGKRQTLADYLFYAVCGGQKNIGAIGYSALPLNLVQASFDQIAKLKKADPSVDISRQSPKNCGNPTFDPAHPNVNRLAEIDPAPPACDKDGAGPCATDVTDPGLNHDPGTHGGRPSNGNGSTGSGTGTGNGNSGGGTGTGSGTGGGGTGGSGTGTGGTGAGGTGTGGAGTGGTGTGGSGAGTGTTPTTGASRDPVTGQLVHSGGQSGAAAAAAQPIPAELAAGQQQNSAMPYASLAIALFALVIVAPPLFARYLRRGRR